VAPAGRDLRRVPSDDVLHIPGQGAAGRGLVHGAERADHPPADLRAEGPDPRRRGISFDATGPETQGFVHIVIERDVIGASYYTFPGITVDQWKALSALR
jgi:hypothetical protein